MAERRRKPRRAEDVEAMQKANEALDMAKDARSAVSTHEIICAERMLGIQRTLSMQDHLLEQIYKLGHWIVGLILTGLGAALILLANLYLELI